MSVVCPSKAKSMLFRVQCPQYFQAHDFCKLEMITMLKISRDGEAALKVKVPATKPASLERGRGPTPASGSLTSVPCCDTTRPTDESLKKKHKYNPYTTHTLQGSGT